MQTPSRSTSSATSCGWMPSIVNDASPPRRSASGGPTTRSPGTSASALEHVRGQRALVRAHALHAELRQVVDGRAQADRLGDRRRAGLELVRQLVPADRLEVDRGDHVAAGQERLHLLEQLARGRAARRCRSARAPCARSRRRSRRRSQRRRPASAAPPARRRSATARRRRGSRAVISATGLIVPSTFETCANATSLHVAARELALERSQRELAALVDLQVAQLAPRSRQSTCQGTRFAWCSICVISTASPARDVRAAPGVGDEVDRLGHVLREDRRRAARRRRTRRPARARRRRPRRPPARARRRRGGRSRCGSRRCSASASITTCGFCEVAPESR